MQRRIERVKSTETREVLDFRALSQNEDGTSDFISLAEDPITAPIIQEIRESSITPTTFVSREFQNSFDDQWYIEQYAYKTNNVVRFGINHLSDQVFSSLSSESVPLFDVTACAASTAKSSSKYTKDDATQIPLCQLETLLLNKACNYLLSAEEDTRAVLVDIFVRVNGGTSNGSVNCKGRVPEMHTVVLYKNPTVTPPELTEGKGAETTTSAPREITVIDPSNFIFSSHLSNYNNLGATVHEGDISFTINTIHKAIQIYQPVTKDIGSAPNQSRDCTDLAVKLALGFNSILEYKSLITFDDVVSCSLIQSLSNVSAIDHDIITPSLPVRMKQTSNLSAVTLFNKIEHSIKNNHTLILHAISLEESAKAKTAVVDILSHSVYDPVTEFYTTLTNLLEHNSKCVNKICKTLSDEHSVLLGLVEHIEDGGI